jgi:hypothetical protein
MGAAGKRPGRERMVGRINRVDNKINLTGENKTSGEEIDTNEF